MDGKDQFDSKKFGETLRDEIHQSIHANMRLRNSSPRQSNGLIPGVILVVIGSVFLLDHMGIIHADTLWQFWPMIIIAIGILKLTQPGEKGLGVGFIVIGTLIQLHQLHVLRFSWANVWPFILIFAGLSLIWSRLEARKISGISGTLSGASSRETVNEYALFGGVERRITVNNFRGGNVTAIFGGVELNFRGADIEGEEAVIYVEAVFGGIEIVVPERWNVAFEVQSVFAGYSDETRQPLPDAVRGSPQKTLMLHGRATFGGITVKN